MDIDLLRSQIVTEFEERWQLNDKAHRQDHFEEVFQCGMKISQETGLNYRPELILFAAYFHDLFAWSRNNHHELSHLWIMTTDHPLVVEHLSGASDRRLVATACLQHRASFQGDFTYGFSALINAADRGFPTSVQAHIERAKNFRRKWHPEMSEDENHAESIAHIKEKYGTGGYARYPEMYQSVFGAELKELQEQIDAL